MGRLQEFQMEMAWNENMFMPNDVPCDIFHYTSASGFESILFSNKKMIELWASRYDCLNDFSEGTVAQGRLKDVCNQMLDSEELTIDLYELIVNTRLPHTTLMWHRDGEKNTLTRPEFVRYVCSFSRNPDSLAMWNYYSKGNRYEGFNLGFFADLMRESVDLQLQPYESKVHLYPVVYDRNEQEKLIHDFICKITEVFKDGDEEILRYMVSNQLLKWALVFKNECFQHEEEIRLIVDVGIQKYESQKHIPQITTNYRISNGYTIPYIILPIEKHCLSYATIGPLNYDSDNKEAQLSILSERLSSGGYCAEEQCSEIPVRY